MLLEVGQIKRGDCECDSCDERGWSWINKCGRRGHDVSDARALPGFIIVRASDRDARVSCRWVSLPAPPAYGWQPHYEPTMSSAKLNRGFAFCRECVSRARLSLSVRKTTGGRAGTELPKRGSSSRRQPTFVKCDGLELGSENISNASTQSVCDGLFDVERAVNALARIQHGHTCTPLALSGAIHQ
jgi:hypothetical protein